MSFFKKSEFENEKHSKNPNYMTLKYYSESKIFMKEASVTFAKSNTQISFL